jgi:hypothetical protein
MPANASTHTGWPLLAALVLLGLGLVQTGDAAAPRQGPGGGQGTQAPSSAAFATADSNNSMIAVTGLDVTGSSILFLVDTEQKQLSVYQATGGTDSMMNVKWVGARKIDLDLRVDGFNDKSEYSYKDLAEQFGESLAGDAGDQEND